MGKVALTRDRFRLPGWPAHRGRDAHDELPPEARPPSREAESLPPPLESRPTPEQLAPAQPEPPEPEPEPPEPEPETSEIPAPELEPEPEPPDTGPEQSVLAEVRLMPHPEKSMDSESRPHLRPVGADGLESEGALARQPEPEPEHDNGVTPPSRRGGSGRFLTDVIVDLGFAERDVVEAAIEAARTAGQAPELVMVEQGTLSADQLARAVAERYGLDHLDLNSFTVDMGAANLIDAGAAKRYEAVPVSFVDEKTLLVAMVDPSNVLAVDDVAIMTG